MRRHSGLARIFLGLLLAAPSLCAAGTLALDPGAGAADPVLRVLDRTQTKLRIALDLAGLELEEMEREGLIYQALSIPGGGLSGLAGEPGLPTFTRLVTLPEGAVAQLRVLRREERRFEGFRPLPVQAEDGEFEMSAEAYRRGLDSQAPAVQLGSPARMGGLRVLPVTFNPVRFDAATGELLVSRRLEVELDFSERDSQAPAVGPERAIPASWHRLYLETVTGYAEAMGDGEAAVAPGTWLVINASNAGVAEALEPLIQWRRRQGYHVVQISDIAAGGSAQAIKAYLQNAYDTWDPPLEFLTLAGDGSGPFTVATWRETLSGYWGEGDHYYTTLDGDDILADVHVGRLSFGSIAELETIVDKILTYEMNPPMGDPGWYTRACLVGDPTSSGISTIYVNQWLKEQLLAQAYTQVDTIWSGPFATPMMNSINQGISVFGYRGFYNMSGISSSHIMNLANGRELPFAVLVTCDTGSFASDANCRSEAFLRSPNGGAVGAVGTATPGTHTRYNNCYYNGVWEGAINGADPCLGVAHTRGKLELYNNYFLSEPANAEIWAVWNSLMGDPATAMWTALPPALEANLPASLPLGANSLPVTVQVLGSPIAGARVALFKSGELRSVGSTDAAGSVNLSLAGAGPGEVLVTASQRNHRAYLGSLSLGGPAAFAALDEYLLDDDGSGESQGNGDQLLNPGERVELTLSLRNLGISALSDVTATLSSRSPLATVLDDQGIFGDIPAGGSVWSADAFVFALAADAPDGERIAFDIVAQSGGDTWTSLLELQVRAASFAWLGSTWSQGEILEPGEQGTLSVALLNAGSLPVDGASAQLTTSSPWILIEDAEGSYGPLDLGEVGSNTADPFALFVLGDCYPGHRVDFTLTLQFAGMAEDRVEFSLPVGEPAASDPLGPDTHGYYAYDDTDLTYAQAPVYSWIELDPVFSGPGTSVGLEDYGSEQDDTQLLPLPFPFRYYGELFDEISVCSNGWIAMGETSLTHYRNWSIPSAGSPDALIAPFWDNLYQPGENQVYFWHDAAEHRFVIQWSRLRNHYSDATQNFEVILYDPLFHPTATGDGEIRFQYHTVNNTDGINGYATTGIQNLDGSGGLLYSYWNQYPPGAAPLQSGRAIRFLPLGDPPHAICTVDPAAFDLVLAPDDSSTHWLRISNTGDADSYLVYTISKRDPNPPGDSPLAERSIAGSTLSANPSHYLPELSMDIDFTALCDSPDGERIKRAEVILPAGVFLESATDMVGGSGGALNYAGGTGEGITAVWQSPDNEGRIHAGESATATVSMRFEVLADTLVLPWRLSGELIGDEPHRAYGDILLTLAGPTILVHEPNGGELWHVDEERELRFFAGGGPLAVDLSLQRGPGQAWETLAQDVPSDQTSLPWTVTGPISADCRVRVADSSDPDTFDESDCPFLIAHSLAWLQVGSSSGQLPQGATEDIQLDIDTTGLPEGEYAIELLIVHNAGAPVAVPVNLLVEEGTAVDPLPPALVLGQNHPNPFNPVTSIAFSLPEPRRTRLEVFDVAGRRVRFLIDETLPSGRHEAVWDGRDDAGRELASGVYLYRLDASGEVLRRKSLLLK